jgi:hypothetical protein
MGPTDIWSRAQRLRFAEIVFLFILCGLCVGVWFTVAPPGQRTRDFTLEDLFIDEAAFPEGWEKNPGGPREACRAAPLGSGCRSADAKHLSFSYSKMPSGLASQEVHVYISPAEAAKDFQRLLDRFFSSGNPYSTPWIVPDKLPYQSRIADQFFFACNTHGGEPYCQMLGQYEEFIIRFHIHKAVISYEDLGRTLQAIDQRIAGLMD